MALVSAFVACAAVTRAGLVIDCLQDPAQCSAGLIPFTQTLADAQLQVSCAAGGSGHCSLLLRHQAVARRVTLPGLQGARMAAMLRLSTQSVAAARSQRLQWFQQPESNTAAAQSCVMCASPGCACACPFCPDRRPACQWSGAGTGGQQGSACPERGPQLHQQQVDRVSQSLAQAEHTQWC